MNIGARAGQEDCHHCGEPKTKRPASFDVSEVHFERKPAVRWHSLWTLVRAGSHALVFKVVGGFSDQRDMQQFLPSARVDLAPVGASPSLHTAGATGEPSESNLVSDVPGREEIWIDFFADAGDGFDAGATVAWALAQEELTLSPREGAGTELLEPYATKRGNVLVQGGDAVYPVAKGRDYEDRFLGPMRAMLDHTCSDHPVLLGLPGNHDWMDGLNSWSKMMTQGGWVGGWKTLQRRSYFATKLSEHWWLLGVDTHLGEYLDAGQVSFFRSLVKTFAPDTQLIICVPAPTWVHQDRDPEAHQALDYFERSVLGSGVQIRLVLTGDLHHYSRYEGAPFSHNLTETEHDAASTTESEPASSDSAIPDSAIPEPATSEPATSDPATSDSATSDSATSDSATSDPESDAQLGTQPSERPALIPDSASGPRRQVEHDTTDVAPRPNRRGRQLITAGGGGAFLSSSHWLPASVELPTPRSRALSKSAPSWYSKEMAYPTDKESKAVGRGFASIMWRNGAFPLLLVLTYLALGWSTLSGSSSTPSGSAVLDSLVRPSTLWLLLFILLCCGSITRAKTVTGALVGLGHFALHLGVLIGITSLWRSVTGSALSGEAGTLLGIGFVAIIGGVLGTLVTSFAMFVGDRVGLDHLFLSSGIRSTKYRNFIRLHLDSDETLRIYPIGIDESPAKWVAASSEEGPWFEPSAPIRPHLIEGPIELRR